MDEYIFFGGYITVFGYLTNEDYDGTPTII